MNHIFRVIFDHTRGVFIAVSELTRNKIKSSKSSRSLSSTNPPKRLLNLSTIALLVGGVLGVSNLSFGEFLEVNSTRIGTKDSTHDKCAPEFSVNLVIETKGQYESAYVQCKVLGAGAVGVGYGTQAKGIQATAIGYSTTANGNYASAYGSLATASGNYASAFGYKAKASQADSTAIGNQATANSQQSIAIGYQAQANFSQYVTVVGAGSKGYNTQATVFGSLSGANSQATAVGNDVYAYGQSSVALGSDDLIGTDGGDTTILEKFGDKLDSDVIDTVYKSLRKDKNFFTTEQLFNNKYKGSNAIYSPTYAGGRGAIAIGSRSVAAEDLSTSLGSLSFALAERSTAVGVRAFVASEAIGGTAMGGTITCIFNKFCCYW